MLMRIQRHVGIHFAFSIFLGGRARSQYFLDISKEKCAITPGAKAPLLSAEGLGSIGPLHLAETHHINSNTYRDTNRTGIEKVMVCLHVMKRIPAGLIEVKHF